MRRLHALSSIAAFAALALGALTITTRAQTSMTFRPLPPESVSQIRTSTGVMPNIQVHGRDRHGRVVDVRIDSNSISINAPRPPAADAPAAPETPEAPAAQGTHETAGDIVKFGSDIEVPADQVVNGDVVSMGGSVRVDGAVRGSVTAMGGDVTLGESARVDRDVVCLGGTLHEDPGSVVRGQRVTAPRQARMLVRPSRALETEVHRRSHHLVVHLVNTLLLLCAAWLVSKLAPVRTQAAIDGIRRSPLEAFLVGAMVLLSPLVVALAALMLVVTIIGLPFAAILIVLYVLLLPVIALLVCWGLVVGCALLGGQLHLRLQQAPAELLRSALWGVGGLGVIAIAGDLLHFLPVFGFLGWLLAALATTMSLALMALGTGALLHGEYARRRGTIGWRNRRGGGPGDDFPAPPPPEPQPVVSPSPAPAPESPPAPPSPPEAYMPPPPPPPAAPSPPPIN